MKLLSFIPSFLTNKFFLAGTGFVFWMFFFDRNDVFSQLEKRSELRQMQESKAFYEARIAEDREFSNDLQFNAAALEKYAREKYLMKKDNEELFLVQPLENKN